MYSVFPTEGLIKPRTHGCDEEKRVRRFDGVAYGDKVVGKYGPGCEAEMINVAIIASGGRSGATALIACYLYVGIVRFEQIAALFGPDSGAAASEFSPKTKLHVVITQYREGCTVHDYFCELARMQLSEDALTSIVAKVYIAIFTVLIQLRDVAGCYHQDAKLDNMLLSTVDCNYFKIDLFDFEMATQQSRPNDGMCIEGFAGHQNYWDAADSFDIHTAVEHGAAYCDDRISACKIFTHLRTTLFNKITQAAPGKNKSGHCNVYLETPHTDALCTFERAIAECKSFCEV